MVGGLLPYYLLKAKVSPTQVVSAGTRPGHGQDTVRLRGHAARSAACLLVDGATAVVVNNQDRWPGWRGPLVTPRHERNNHWRQIPALVRQQILDVVRMLGIASRRHESRVDEALETGGQDVRRQPKTPLKLGEAGDAAKERVANDEQAPAFANQLERSRGGTVLVGIGATEHAGSLPRVLAS
jgi:hypothetical protein